MKHISFDSPIVGMHVRRTDKLKHESKLYSIDQYFEWAEFWFKFQEKRNVSAPKLKRRVYIATGMSIFLMLKNGYFNRRSRCN